jgi:hypothetical protein
MERDKSTTATAPLLRLVQPANSVCTEWQFDERHAMVVDEVEDFTDSEEDEDGDDASSGLTANTSKNAVAAASFDDREKIGQWPLRVEQHPTFGRHVVASRDLSAGELIFEEEPFVQTIHDRCHNTACHVCYRDLAAAGPANRQPVVCGDCRQVCFCSAECARLGESAHDGECDVLSALVASGNTSALSGVRGLRLFIKLVHRAAEEPDTFATEIEAMAEHYEDAEPERRRWLDTMAANINRFVPPERRMHPVRLAKLVSRVHTNLYGIVDQAGLQYGSGLYAKAGSLFNHSCAPTACVSFLGRTWRLHTLRTLAPGEEVTVSYTELFASRSERRSAIKAKKGFWCMCTRCTAPPAGDAPLDGWRCAARGRTGEGACGDEGGVVPPDAAHCARCGAAHIMPPPARHAREIPWREAIDKGSVWAHTPAAPSARSDGGKPKAEGKAAADDASAEEVAARRVLRSVERVLKESQGALCDGHTLRHAARKLRVYALSSLPTRAQGEMVEALEELVAGMENAEHVPRAHPELAFFRHRFAQALEARAQLELAQNTNEALANSNALRARARAAARSAAAGLAIAYGNDHPTVKQYESGRAE